MTSDDGAPGTPGPERSAAIRFTIGAQVWCRDGHCGHLARVVVDPVARVLTHLVVEPRRHHKFGRLVPVELVDSSGDRVHLRCTRAEFTRLDEAEEIHFIPCDPEAWGYRSGEALALPYYGLPTAALLGGRAGLGMSGAPPAPRPIVSDRVPAGEVEIRRGDQVHASDGPVGTVQGLVIDPRDHHVTHVLLQQGHVGDGGR